MPDAEVHFYPEFFTPAESTHFLSVLTGNIAWEQREIQVPGKKVPLPRLVAWYGDAGKSYRYSGITMQPHPWTDDLLAIKQRVEAEAGVSFNSVLLNLYRSEADSVSWHSDDEPELGENPVIASVSFGATRAFQFKHKHANEQRRSIELTPGSLLIMRGATQHFWKHQLPKSKQPSGARINLTFRVIHASG
jgi:alkylated DNA repair dioxygenase AlkB